MAFKYIILCASAFLIQSIDGQFIRPSSSCSSITLSKNGGPLAITSIGPIVPSGIAAATDLGLSGNLDLSGALPYLSAVAFEGQFDTTGSTPLSYGCGDTVAITKEVTNLSGYDAPLSSSLSAASTNSCGAATLLRQL